MPKGSNAKVLVVDDCKPWQDFICSVVGTARGWQVVARASDGAEAVQKATDLKPDLILLDIGLPTLNGIEVARKIGQSAPKSRILFVSENRSEDLVEAALGTGAEGYIRKSDAAKDLLPALDRLFEREFGESWQRDPAEADPYRKHNTRPGMVCEQIVDDALALMRSDYASMQILFPERGAGGELMLLAFRGFSPEAARFWERVHADSKSTCGIALRTTQRVVAPDIAACDFMADSEDQQVYLRTGIRACQTTPLIGSTGEIVGMLSTHWRTTHQPSEEDFCLFDILARHAADLIEHLRREDSAMSAGGASPQ